MIVGTEGSKATNFSKLDDCHLRVPASSQTAKVSNLTPLRRESTLQEQMLRVLTTSISSSRRMPLRRAERSASFAFGVLSDLASVEAFVALCLAGAASFAVAGDANALAASSAAVSQAAARSRHREGTASVAIVITRIIDMAATNWLKQSGLGDV